MAEKIDTLVRTFHEVEDNLQNPEGLGPENEAELQETLFEVSEEISRALGEEALISLDLVRRDPRQGVLF